MSVKVTDREESKAAFLGKLLELNKKIGITVANGPKKYSHTYGDRLISKALDALAHATEANSIYVGKGLNAEADSRLRRELFLRARGEVKAVSSIASVYFRIMRNSDSVKPTTREKATDRMESIGCLCYDISNLITGVIKSDKERYNG